MASRSRRGAAAPVEEPEPDGKVVAGCPRCGETLSIAEDLLEQKIECPSCHRTFFPKTTVGVRTKKPDHAKTYWLFGLAAVAVIGSFFVISSLGERKGKPSEPAPTKKIVYTRTTHPRTAAVLAWAQAIRNDNQLVFATHTDMLAAARLLGAPPGNRQAILAAVATHASLKLLRDMDIQRSALLTDDAMTAATGRATLTLTPRPGTDDFTANAQAEVEVAFKMEEDQVKVTDWTVVQAPQRNALKR